MIATIISKLQAYWDAAKFKNQAKKLRASDEIILANQLIDSYWQNNTEVIKDFSKDFVLKTSTKMMEEVLVILGSDNPLMANREKLSEHVIECAKYQVLVLTPNHTDDVTGMVGKCGISGGLKERILDLIKIDKDLKEVFHSQPDDVSFGDAWDFILMKYRYTWAFMNVIAGMRTYLKDSNLITSKDWLRPYFVSMCAWQESTYRAELGMSNLLEDNPDSKFSTRALAYSAFLDFVMRGDTYPDLTWDEAYPDLESPRIL
jgi:hypothetical protein